MPGWIDSHDFHLVTGLPSKASAMSHGKGVALRRHDAVRGISVSPLNRCISPDAPDIGVRRHGLRDAETFHKALGKSKPVNLRRSLIVEHAGCQDVLNQLALGRLKADHDVGAAVRLGNRRRTPDAFAFRYEVIERPARRPSREECVRRNSSWGTMRSAAGHSRRWRCQSPLPA